MKGGVQHQLTQFRRQQDVNSLKKRRSFRRVCSKLGKSKCKEREQDLIELYNLNLSLLRLDLFQPIARFKSLTFPLDVMMSSLI